MSYYLVIKRNKVPMHSKTWCILRHAKWKTQSQNIVVYDSTAKNVQNRQLYSQKEDYDYLRLEKKPEWVLGFFMELQHGPRLDSTAG